MEVRNTAPTALGRLEDQLTRVAGAPVSLERPAKAEHGDYATNVALRLAGAQKRAPLEIAAELAERATTLLGVDSAETTLLLSQVFELGRRAKPWRALL